MNLRLMGIWICGVICETARISLACIIPQITVIGDTIFV